MNNVVLKISFVVFLSGLAACGGKSSSEIKEAAKEKSAEKDIKTENPAQATTDENQNTKTTSVKNEESDFLLKAIDSRMMGILEGKEALKKGSTQDIKNYGALMIRDQTRILNDLKKLMHSLSMSIPDTITGSKQDGLKALMQRNSRKFDKKFIKMMKIDHRRDVRLFTKAKDFDNKKISSFATLYLPLIETHLDKVQELKKTEEGKRKSKNTNTTTGNQ